MILSHMLFLARGRKYTGGDFLVSGSFLFLISVTFLKDTIIMSDIMRLKSVLCITDL